MLKQSVDHTSIDDDKKMNSSEEKNKCVLNCEDEHVDEEVEIEWEDG